MQAQSTTASRPGTWVASHGWRTCHGCKAVIREGDSHLAFGPTFRTHQCNRCTGVAVALQRTAKGVAA